MARYTDDDDFDDDEDRPVRRRRRPVSRGGTSGTKIVLGVAGGIILVGCLGIGGCIALIGFGVKSAADADEKNRQEVVNAQATAIDAETLHAEYKANEVAADKKYKGKVLEVTGTVKEIKKDVFNHPCVLMELNQNQFMSSVDCRFPDTAQAQLGNLRKGDQITVRGRCEGMLISAVQLKDCILK